MHPWEAYNSRANGTRWLGPYSIVLWAENVCWMCSVDSSIFELLTPRVCCLLQWIRMAAHNAGRTLTYDRFTCTDSAARRFHVAGAARVGGNQ